MKCLDEVRIYSPNMFKLFEDCPLKFYYRYVLKVSAPILDKNFQTGKNIHSVAAYYLKGVDVSKFEKAMTDKEQNLWKYLKDSKYFGLEVIEVEKSLNMRLGSFRIGGRIDSVVRSEGEYFILDYKTGSINREMLYDYQTMIYILLCEEYFGSNKLNFVYLDLKNKRDILLKYTKDLKEVFIKKIAEGIDNIESYNWSDHKCEKSCDCEYLKICNPKL